MRELATRIAAHTLSIVARRSDGRGSEAGGGFGDHTGIARIFASGGACFLPHDFLTKQATNRSAKAPPMAMPMMAPTGNACAEGAGVVVSVKLMSEKEMASAAGA